MVFLFTRACTDIDDRFEIFRSDIGKQFLSALICYRNFLSFTERGGGRVDNEKVTIIKLDF